MNQKRLWASRFSEEPSGIAQEISESISFDYLLAPYDLAGSRAHVKMLAAQNILSEAQVKNILTGLQQVEDEINDGKMQWNPQLEDIHMHIEARLTEIIGEDGKRLHTGRSRNDQVALDTVMFLRENSLAQRKDLIQLLRKIYELSKASTEKLWAGYTHLQVAQPVLLSHYLLSWFWAFERDLNCLDFCLQECSKSPLGSAALAGPNYPIDRELTAKSLGFEEPTKNSMDSVAQRDYQLSYHFFASRLFIHISRLCEDFIIYNSVEFSFVDFTEKVTTGSSIMPQKKNPDIAELLRGKSGRVIGNMVSLLTALKGLPSSYNRDLQEDKVYLFDTVRQVTLGIRGVLELFNNITFNSSQVEKSLQKGFAQATDIADYLVREKAVPFRRSHEMVGELVKTCIERNITLDYFIENQEPLWAEKIILPESVLDLERCAMSKMGQGSAGSESQQVQLKEAKALIDSLVLHQEA